MLFSPHPLIVQGTTNKVRNDDLNNKVKNNSTLISTLERVTACPFCFWAGQWNWCGNRSVNIFICATNILVSLVSEIKYLLLIVNVWWRVTSQITLYKKKNIAESHHTTVMFMLDKNSGCVSDLHVRHTVTPLLVADLHCRLTHHGTKLKVPQTILFPTQTNDKLYIIVFYLVRWRDGSLVSEWLSEWSRPVLIRVGVTALWNAARAKRLL